MFILSLIVLQAAVGAGIADDAFREQMSLGNIEVRTVAKSTDAEYYAFPSVCRLKNGDLLCVFYNGTAHVCPDSKVALVRSTDEGKTWSKPVTIIDTRMDDRDPSIMQTREGRILVSFFTRDSGTTGSAKETNKVLVSASEDGGKTFGAPKHIDVGWHWEATSDEILELKDGTLLCPIYGAMAGDKTWRAGVAFSRDGGRTWNKEPVATVAYDGVIRYEEPALLQLPDGTILCELRTTNADGYIYESKSTDGGKTWTKPRKLDLLGQASGLLYHSSGTIFHAYRERSSAGQTLGVAGVFCKPGEEWNAEKQFSILKIGGDVAYPSSVELEDHSILTVYYTREHRAIEAAVFSPKAIKALK